MKGILSGAFAVFGFVLTLVGGFDLGAGKTGGWLIWSGFVFVAMSQAFAFMAGQERGI